MQILQEKWIGRNSPAQCAWREVLLPNWPVDTNSTLTASGDGSERAPAAPAAAKKCRR